MSVTLKGRDMLSTKDLDRGEMEHIFDVADKFDAVTKSRTKLSVLSDKIMASLFFQPSTRTRLSFESAMQRLGGSVIGWADPKVSRAGDAFEESLEDTARMIDLYADIAVIRHFQAGAPARFAKYATIPVVNGGDGHGAMAEHPTQALGDLYTIRKDRGTIDGVTICMMGDLTGRVQHSLGYALARYNNVKAYLLSPRTLKLPDEVAATFKKMGLWFKEVQRLSDIISELDVIHLTGIRSTGIHTQGKIVGAATEDEYTLNTKRLRESKKGLTVLHPLPRIDELSTDLDETPYNRYFAEAYGCLLVRMALVCLVLGRDI